MNEPIIPENKNILLQISIVRWAARILALLLFILWGMFFIEHLSYLIPPYEETPPWWVWGLQAVHLVMLLSLLATWKWERAGSLVLAVSAAVFFGFAAGLNGFLFYLVTCLPIIGYAYTWWRSQRLTEG
jgi:hypothetical protein